MLLIVFKASTSCIQVKVNSNAVWRPPARLSLSLPILMQPPSLLDKEAFVTGHNGTSAGHVLLLLLPLPLSICTSQWWGSNQGNQPQDYQMQLWQLPGQFVLIVVPHVLAVMSDISPGVPLAMAAMFLLTAWLLHRRTACRQASMPPSCTVQLHR